MLKKLFGKAEKNTEKKPEEKVIPSATSQEDKKEQQDPPTALQLEHAMVENVRLNNQQTREKVYQELLFSELLLALTEEPVRVENTDEVAQNSINIAILANPQGVQFSAVFTSAVAAKRWRADGGHYVAMRGQDIFRVVEPSPADVIVVNPGSAPFAVLNKADFKQLALGLLPQGTQSPVQMSSVAPAPGQEGEEQGLQIAFPPDAFTAEQKQRANDVLVQNAHIVAAALGAILPPGAPKDTGWVRAIFLRVTDLAEDPESMQKFCQEIREQLQKGEHFASFPFEVGAMPDINFWAAMHKNNLVLFDKKPSDIPTNP